VKLGVLDWGIGGIDAWRRLTRALPGHDYVYVSDAGFTPYGKVAPALLCARVQQLAERMAVDALVIACNAASTIIDELDLAIPVVGVIAPGIRLVEMLGIPTIGIMGGERTIAAGIHERAFTNAGRRVVAVACQPLSAHVEAGRLDGPEVLRDLVPRLAELGGVDATLLACTHYPALLPVLTRLAPTMRWLDPIDLLVHECATRWPLIDDRRGTSRVSTTGSPDAMRAASQAAFGVALDIVNLL